MSQRTKFSSGTRLRDEKNDSKIRVIFQVCASAEESANIISKRTSGHRGVRD